MRKPLSCVKQFFRFIIFGLNLVALAGGITYLVHPTPYMLLNLYGYAVLLAMIGNIALVCLGGRYRYLDYCYLGLHMISMLLIPVMSTVASSDVQNRTSQSILTLILCNVIFLYGALNAGIQIRCSMRRDETGAGDNAAARSGRLKSSARWAIIIALCLVLLSGLYISYILIGRTTGNMIEVFIHVYSVYWGLLMFGAAILIIRLRWRKKGSVINRIAFGAGVVILIVCMMPLAAIPFTVSGADAAFREAFGDAYLDDETLVEQYGFMRLPFSLQDYFFGTRTREYSVIEDVLYYEGTDGADAGARLRFDVYMPLADSGNPPGKNSVLIRIHGGAWVTGGKGAMNYSATNKHFVNLGYVVFDIQYGLSNRSAFLPSGIVPTDVIGDFGIDDMVRHIGIFTTFLADHADVYGADLDSVFISGASAGGQLAIASALGITSGRYTDVLDPRLNVRGIIPFYPANGLSSFLGNDSDLDLVDPVALVDKNSPPCLIFHGTHDGIVPPGVASAFQRSYEDNSDAPSALLWMNLASHGSDIYTSGFFNRVFLYYMERFMYQFS